MVRDFQTAGECLVSVKFGAHIPNIVANYYPTGGGPPPSNLSQLGLCSDAIRISPRFVHHEIHIDDFGPNIPAEVLSMIADVQIDMTLIHYDNETLDLVMAESMGGVAPAPPTFFNGSVYQSQAFGGTGNTPAGLGFAGQLVGAGSPLGNGLPLLASGNHYISLNIATPQMANGLFPWRFPASYLMEPPVEIPLGTEKQMIKLKFRAIPYGALSLGMSSGVQTGEIQSSGALLWDHNTDV